MKKLTRKQWLVGLAASGILICTFGFLIFKTESPSLGGEFEYIGHRAFGCLLFWCDGPSYTEYYFATDMTEDQLKHAFSGGQFTDIGLGGENPDYYYNELKFRATDGRIFYLDYYHGVKPSQMDIGLVHTNKLYGISIKDSDYKIAKEAL